MPDLLDRLKTALADRYAIEREIGAGGMATVYLARDLKHDRHVAVKVLRPELAAVVGAERFLREIKITAQLNHPHILPLLDSGDAEGFLYYVMPYVEGESLRDWLDREKQLPVEVAIRAACQVASALSYAHSHDVIHRDIKPENILLSHGEAVVADFGIGRAITAAGGEGLTETGLAVGTPTYMSPEQGSGEKELSGRSDIYALACVLYEMLVGQPPFTGTNAQAILARHAMEAVPRLRVVRSRVPDYVEHAIEKAMAKVPADRFETATEFAEALVGVSMNAAAAQPVALSIPDEARRRLKWRLGIGVAGGAILAATALMWGLTTTSNGLSYVVVGPLPTKTRGSSPTEQFGPWAVADRLNAMFASDSVVRVVDPRAVERVSAEFLSARNDELTREEWLQVAKELGASQLVVLDTTSWVLIASGRAIIGIHMLVLSVPRGDTVMDHYLGGHDLPSGTVFRKAEPSDSGIISEFRDVPDRDLVARRVARLLRPGQQEMFPWGVDSILASIEPGAAPRFVEGVRALESGLYLEAVDRFDRALSLDPDFTLAAIGLLQAGSLAGDEGMSAADHAAGRAWELRERLSERDRDLVATFLGIGPNYPAPSTRTEYLAFADTVIFSYLEEGRIGAATGNTKSAIWAYHRYLTLRASPDPEQRPDVEEVWAQLLRLYPEPGTR